MQYSVDYPNLNYPNYYLQKKKNYGVLSNYGLLYWNITKPVKTVQEFINLSKFTCVFLFLYKHVDIL